MSAARRRLGAGVGDPGRSLDFAADRLAAIGTEHARDAVGVFGGGTLTHEKAYSLGKFARVVLQTPHIDDNGRFLHEHRRGLAAGLRCGPAG
ncbi:hypothetical protein KGQ20_29430 [Catenulispora sp. NF23]|uniref:hypothetical protein n=1 Tax=Catenulispora pinistramenti TaxID=2705254 RepID=UPI001BACD86B|nr:hypothetical protein [Catenulispora pinistramenti]MBS2536893.1 hypothetical protein [Catenulispora pinistramenti]